MTRISAVQNVASWTTDAKVRSWGSAVSSSLAACGLVQTADTGQINHTTTTHPAAANTLIGYEVWRFNDTLQATRPIYLKMSYYTSAATSGAGPHMRYQMGTGSDGAGNLTGLMSSSLLHSPSSGVNQASSSTTQQMLFTHTEGYFLMYASSNSGMSDMSNSPFWLAVCRTFDPVTGVPTGSGMQYVRAGYLSNTSVNLFTQHFNFDLQVIINSSEFTGLGFPPVLGTSMGSYTFPIYTCLPEPQVNAALLGYKSADIAHLSTFTCKPIGSSITRTYIALTGAQAHVNSIAHADISGLSATSQNSRCAFLWED